MGHIFNFLHASTLWVSVIITWSSFCKSLKMNVSHQWNVICHHLGRSRNYFTFSSKKAFRMNPHHWLQHPIMVPSCLAVVGEIWSLSLPLSLCSLHYLLLGAVGWRAALGYGYAQVWLDAGGGGGVLDGKVDESWSGRATVVVVVVVRLWSLWWLYR